MSHEKEMMTRTAVAKLVRETAEATMEYMDALWKLHDQFTQLHLMQTLALVSVLDDKGVLTHEEFDAKLAELQAHRAVDDALRHPPPPEETT
jgi:hypothetical protein